VHNYATGNNVKPTTCIDSNAGANRYSCWSDRPRARASKAVKRPLIVWGVNGLKHFHASSRPRPGPFHPNRCVGITIVDAIAADCDRQFVLEIHITHRLHEFFAG